MKQESDHSPLLWSVVIAIFGLAAIAFYYRRECENKKSVFPAPRNSRRYSTSRIQKGTPRNNADNQLQLRTPFIVSPGKLKSDDGEFAVNRKLFFRYARPLGHTAGVLCSLPMVGKNPR